MHTKSGGCSVCSSPEDPHFLPYLAPGFGSAMLHRPTVNLVNQTSHLNQPLLSKQLDKH
jgi:hypothetical protein